MLLFPLSTPFKVLGVQDNIALPEFTSDCWFLGNTTMKARLGAKIFNFQIQISILFTLRNGTIISLSSAVQFLAMPNKYELLTEVCLFAVQYLFT